MKDVTPYQREILTTIRSLEKASGKLTDFDQLLEKLSWAPSKESTQFIVRALIVKKLIEKAPKELRRGRTRICYQLTNHGKAVFDPRILFPVMTDSSASGILDSIDFDEIVA